MKHILFWIIIIAAFSGCRKDSLTEIREKTDFHPEILYRVSMQGEVVDINGTPIPGAEVSAGAKMTLTDDDGLFEFTGIEAGSRGRFIKATAPDYFTGGTMLYAQNSSPKSIRIVLNPLRLEGSFDSQTGGTIDVGNGGTITFQAGDLIGPNGPYSGPVRVMATWLDPSDNSIFERMPGDLSALDADGERVTLETYGMMAVELIGSAGEKLQPHPDRPATLSMNVPPSLQSSAPQEIPLWHFDESNGMWIEEGRAELQNGQYVGNVTHFSWWNCDKPGEGVFVCFQLKDEGDVNLGNIRIKACATNINTCGYNFTDPNGIACGWVWKGQELNISIQNICGTFGSPITIDPILETPADPIELSVTSNDEFAFSLEGIVRNCDDAPVPDAMVTLTHNNLRTVIRADMDGKYNYSGFACENGGFIHIQAINPGELKSGETTVNISGPGIFKRDLALCTTITEFLALTVNGKTIFSSRCKARMTNVETQIFAWDSVSKSDFHLFNFDGFDKGTFRGGYFGDFSAAFEPDDIEFVIFSYGNIGGLIQGRFEGKSKSGDVIGGRFKATRER